jgi:hypothetical protein
MQPRRVPTKAWNEVVKRFGARGGLTTGLIILSSAALGGIAVALWNRKALATFRELELDDGGKTSTGECKLDVEHEDEFF